MSIPSDTIESRLATAGARITELESSIASITTIRDTAQNELAASTIRVTSLETVIEDTLGERDSARSEVAALQAQSQALTQERDSARLATSAAAVQLARLESLCGVNGIDITQAPVNGKVTPPAEPLSVATFEARMKAAKTNSEKSSISAEFIKAVGEGKLSKTKI